MRMPWSKFEGPARLLMLFVTILLVASGLCGLQWVIVTGMAGSGAGGYIFVVLIGLGYAELFAIAVSLAGAVGVLVWLGVRALYRLATGRESLPKEKFQALFPKEKSEDRDD
jgi:hypothetical protein